MVVIFRCRLWRCVLNSLLFLFFCLIATCSAVGQSDIYDDLKKKESEELIAALTDKKLTDFFEKQHYEGQAISNKDQAKVMADQQRIKRLHFYNDYLACYYPKAFVITYQIFQQMDPEGIEEALRVLVDVLTQKTWFYFFNKPQGFKVIHFWEFIVDQLTIIHDFLSHACVNIANKKVFIPTDDDFFVLSMLMLSSKARQSRNRKLLIDYLTGPGKTVIYEFYALCFDFVIKLFNEGILLQNLGQAMIYLSELEYLVERLRGSSFEAVYQEAVKTAQELLDLLKQRFGISNCCIGDEYKGRVL